MPPLAKPLVGLASVVDRATFGTNYHHPRIIQMVKSKESHENPTISEVSLEKEGFTMPTHLNGSTVRVGIVMARWNSDIIQGLYKGVNESLTACGVQPHNVITTRVPGAFELPVTARLLAASKTVDVVICLGCLIKGKTMHFEYISQAVSSGLMKVAVDSLVPCIFGVLTVGTKQQAITRSTGKSNEGLSWGPSAVEMGLARISALGEDRPREQGGSSPFVAFKGTAPVVDMESTTTQKRIGF